MRDGAAVRAIVVYAPAIVVAAIGLLVLLAVPLVHSTPACPCQGGPNGNATPCPPCAPPGTGINLTGPLLEVAAAGYAIFVYAWHRG